MPNHEVTNQVADLHGYNLLQSDPGLDNALTATAHWHWAELTRFGAELGDAQFQHLAQLANRHRPELETHDRSGHRVDQVNFHPAWHTLLTALRRQGLQALPWLLQRPGVHVARTIGYFMQAQIEAGSLCPTTMTYASIAVLRQEPALYAALEAKLLSREHDPRDLPIAQKTSILIGMGMTEKQGGSDVRSNTTLAHPIGFGGRGEAYALTGHKWFFSAPMCDAHLVLARSEAGLSCFFVPRWRPDGSKNAVLIQRLKDKLGNCSNASSEVEFDQAFGIMVGPEGRGVPTIIEMANSTRLDCVIGSAALMRQGLVQALHHARHRNAFGRPLIEQPLMRNVLCDLALESSAATLLMLRLAHACEDQDAPLERAWRRIVTPAAKFWVCKRAVGFTGECMEVWGGNGYIETGPMARLYREAPVNSIWEGSGNLMCLDVLRAVERDPQGLQMLLDQVAALDATLASPAQALLDDFNCAPDEREARARRLVQRLVLLLQSALLRQHAPGAVADAFAHSRCAAPNSSVSAASEAALYGQVYGSLPPSLLQAEMQEQILQYVWNTKPL